MLYTSSLSAHGFVALLNRCLSELLKDPAAQKIFMPSLFIFLSVSAAILLAVAPVCGARTALLLVIAVSCSLIVAARINIRLTEAAPALGHGAWTAHVESVESRRYYREAVVRFRGSEAVAVDGAGAWRRGVVRVAGGGFGAGDIIGFTGKPRPVDARGAADSCADLRMILDGVRYVVYPGEDTVTVIADASPLRERTRERLAANCDSLFAGKTAAMVKALYFGNQDYIDKLTMNDFKRAGVFHILSAGGLHVGIALLLTPPSLTSINVSIPYNLRPLSTTHSSRYN